MGPRGQSTRGGGTGWRYEHLLDRFCLDHAFTLLCAFDNAGKRSLPSWRACTR